MTNEIVNGWDVVDEMDEDLDSNHFPSFKNT